MIDVAEILVEHRVDREDADGPDEQRVAVGGRFRCERGADGAVRPWAIVDDDGLAELLAFSARSCASNADATGLTFAASAASRLEIIGNIGPMSAMPASVTASCSTRMGPRLSRSSSRGM